jgi:glycyl-tRNA synthetase beta subunit
LSKKTPLQRVEESEKLLEKIMLIVPGFSGYKKREQRREADKIIRNFLHSKLQEARNDLQDIHTAVAKSEQSKELDRIDKLLAVFDGVSERVNHASYGYSGFFDAIKIEEPELDRMIAFDTQLVDGAKGLAERVKNIKTEVDAERFENLTESLSELRKAVEDFDRMFDERKEVIAGVEVG